MFVLIHCTCMHLLVREVNLAVIVNKINDQQITFF